LNKINYFKEIAFDKGFSTLEHQNFIYLKEFSNFNKIEFKSSTLDNINLKIINENSNKNKEIKVNFYTYKNGIKIDSIAFYRNISGHGYGKYNCLSYFDKNTSKIWQINYFPFKNDQSFIVSYSESNITSEGKIKLDSLHYLDESLEVEMENYNLNY